MRYISESVAMDKPFYVQLWFHAPHGPWETIPGYDALYSEQDGPTGSRLPDCQSNFQPAKQRYCRHNNRVRDRGSTRFHEYRTMVSDMDAQVGMLLRHVHALGLDEHTLVVFSSDNGPEDAAGGAGPLRGNKRHLHEGGIRVPGAPN
jgi:arylsulfatase A-like enzyme